MATLTDIAKNDGNLSGVQKPSSGQVFFGWLFWFTQPVFGADLTSIATHAGSLTSVSKH